MERQTSNAFNASRSSRLFYYLIGLLFVLCCFCFSSALAATVTDPSDSGMGTLRDVLAAAFAGDYIDFDPSIRNIALLSTLDVPVDVIIDGNDLVTIDGVSASFDCFHIPPTIGATLTRLLIQNCARGVYDEGVLTMTYCSISSCVTGVHTVSSPTINNNTIWMNSQNNILVEGAGASSALITSSKIGLDPATGLCPLSGTQNNGVSVLNAGSYVTISYNTISCCVKQISIMTSDDVAVTYCGLGVDSSNNQEALAWNSADIYGVYAVNSNFLNLYTVTSTLPIEVYNGGYHTIQTVEVGPFDAIFLRSQSKMAAIYIEQASNSMIEYCNIDGVPLNGNGMVVVQSPYSQVRYNYIGLFASNYGNGISISNSGNLLISRNTVQSSFGWGILVDRTGDTTTDDTGILDWNIIGNIAFPNQAGGVKLLNAIGTNFTNNIIQYNSVTGVSIVQTTSFTGGNAFTQDIGLSNVITCNPDCSFPNIPIDIQGDSVITIPQLYPPADNLMFIRYPTITSVELTDPDPIPGSLWTVTVTLPDGYYPPLTNFELSLYSSDQDTSIVTGDNQNFITVILLTTTAQGGYVALISVSQPTAIPMNETCICGQLYNPAALMLSVGPVYYPSTSEVSYCHYYVPPSPSTTPSISPSISVSSSQAVTPSTGLISSSVSPSLSASLSSNATATPSSPIKKKVECFSQKDCQRKLKKYLKSTGVDYFCDDLEKCGSDSKKATSCFETTKTSSKCDILPIKFVVEDQSDEPKNIPLVTSSGHITGHVVILTSTFPLGTTLDLTVAFPDDDKQSLEDADKKLGGDKIQVSSAGMWRVRIFSKAGQEIFKFSPPICLTMLIQLEKNQDLQKETCMSYTNDKTSKWICPEYGFNNDDIIKLDNDGFYSVTQCYDHVTTFAVLFQLSSPDDNFGTGGPSNGLWIASITILASAPVIAALILVLTYYTQFGRKMMYGREKSGNLNEILKKVERAVSHESLR